MPGLDDLFPDTIELPLSRLPKASDGGHSSLYELSSLGSLSNRRQPGNRHFVIGFYDGEDEFRVEVYEVVTGLTGKHSSRIKNPKQWQMSRNVWASVPPIDDYNTIADAVCDVVTRLRENYWARYKATLDLPLEEIIAIKLQDTGMQPPYEA